MTGESTNAKRPKPPYGRGRLSTAPLCFTAIAPSRGALESVASSAALSSWTVRNVCGETQRGRAARAARPGFATSFQMRSGEVSRPRTVAPVAGRIERARARARPRCRMRQDMTGVYDVRSPDDGLAV